MGTKTNNKRKRVEAEPLEEQGEETALAISSQEGQSALADADRTPPPISFQDGMQLLPSERMKEVLEEYTNRRKTFMEWLRSVLIEGVHYGFPPGCQPRKNAQGEIIDKKGNVIPPEQWKYAPSLYQAGADFLCELLKFRPDYAASSELWEQGGSQPGHYYFRCRLFNRLGDGECLGEGHGSYKIDNQHDQNAAVKMAQKCAKVSAVLNVLGITDQFTQDLENKTPPPSPQPNGNPESPNAPTRNERQTQPKVCSTKEFKALVKAWQAKYPGSSKEQFAQWVTDQTGLDRDFRKPESWTEKIVTDCREALR